MNSRFIFFVALRYLKARRKSKKTASSLLSIAMLAVGVMTLTVVIGVMNGFQLSFIEPILNVNSYHIQIHGGEIPGEKMAELLEVPGVRGIVPFLEVHGILDGTSPCLLRCIPRDILERDPSFGESFNSLDYDIPGGELLSSPGSVVIGHQLALAAGVGPGEKVEVLTLSGKPATTLKVKGVFKTGFSQIDESWAFVSLEEARDLGINDPEKEMVYGVKLKNRFNDRPAEKHLRGILGKEYEVQSWRVFNANFFSALFTEKMAMMLLICLIFILVAFNVFHSLKRSIQERAEEIALFKALGTRASVVRNIFILEGFLIGVIGVFVGMLLGLVLSYNIDYVFRGVEQIVNSGVIPVAEKFLSLFHEEVNFSPVYIFSPQLFYIDDQIPVRVLWEEMALLNGFAILCCLGAGYFSSRRIAFFKPARILRYE